MKRGMLLLVVLAAGILSGCTNYQLAKGNRNYEELRYHSAIDNYRKFLKSNDDPEVRLRLVESCMKVNRFHEAFEELSKFRQENDPSVYWLIQGRKLMDEGKYDAAEIAFRNFLDKNPKNDVGEKLCKSCSSIKAMMQDTGYYEVKPVMLKGFDNYYSATHFKKGLIIAAGKRKLNEKDALQPSDNYNLFYLEKDSAGNYNEPVAMSGLVNGNYNETCPCVNPEDGQLVFTRSKIRNKKSKETHNNNLKILFANYKENAWKDIREFPYNNQKYNVGHPSVSSKHQAFFFVSDKPGGQGGLDIYYSIMSGGGFSEPRNLGTAVNTPGNEMFPWYNEADSSLYFSSQGHSNFGGLDIFKVKFIDGKAGEAVNLGFPVNSSKDDFSYLLNKDNKTGYFSSNRSGSDKLYEVKALPPQITVTGMIHENELKPLEQVNILIYDSVSGTKKEIQTDDKGGFKTSLEADRDYLIEISKTNYYKPGPVKISTYHITKHQDFPLEIEMQPIELGKSVIIGDLHYDVNSWQLNEASKRDLDKLYQVMKENPGIVIEIASYTDSRANEIYNLKLSERRAKEVAEYIISKGIPENRITWKGYGKSSPLNVCTIGCSEDDHSQNRRTEFKIIEINSNDLADKNPAQGN